MPKPACLYDLPRLLWLRAVEQRLQRQSEPALHVLRPAAPHPPPPSPSRGEGEHGISPLPHTGRGAGGEGLDLHAGLSAWQDIMARWRLVAVLRRWAIVALALVLLLAVPGRLSTSLPAWI